MPVLGGGGGVQTDTLTAITATPAFDGTSARFSNYQSGLFFWGFAADGDYILASAASATTSNAISYYNSAGSLQWTVNATDFNASATGFCAICKEGSYIYAVATQSGSTSAWIAKIDSSGSVSDITSITMTGTTFSYKDFTSHWLGVPDGESDIYLVGGQMPSTSFNPSTLTTVTTCASQYLSNTFLASNLPSFYVIDVRNGTYGMYSIVGSRGPEITGYNSNFPASKINSEKLGFSIYNGISVNQYIKVFYWDGYAIPGSTTILGTASKAYAMADYDAFAKNFLLEAGVYRDNTGLWS